MTETINDNTILEQRRQWLVQAMDDHDIKGSALSTVARIGASNLSMMRKGKLPITPKALKSLEEAIEKILADREGLVPDVKVKRVPVDEPAPLPVPVIVKKSDQVIGSKKFNIPEYLLQHLQVKGDTFVKKSFVQDDPARFIAHLKEKGFDVSLKLDRDGDYLVSVNAPVSEEIIEKVTKPEPKVEPKHPVPIGQMVALVGLDGVKTEKAIPEVPAISRESMVEFIKFEIDRNRMMLENVDPLDIGEKNFKRLTSRTPILAAILQVLEAPEAKPAKNLNQAAYDFCELVERINGMLIAGAEQFIDTSIE